MEVEVTGQVGLSFVTALKSPDFTNLKDTIANITDNPLDLDLVDRPEYLEWGINNTVGQWTPLLERVTLLRPILLGRELIRSLYFTGYGQSEIAVIGGKFRQHIHRQVQGVQRPPSVGALRAIFYKRYGMDRSVGILHDFIVGLTPAETAEHNGISRKSLAGKQSLLKAAGFPIPEAPEAKKVLPAWKQLINGSEWIRLTKALKESGRKSLRTLDLLFQTLDEEGFRVIHRTVHFHSPDGELKAANHYFIHQSERERFEKLLNERPEVVRARTWSSVRQKNLSLKENPGSH